MLQVADEIVAQAQKRVGRPLKIVRVEDGLIFEHRNALYFVAEIDLSASHIAVPLAVDFPEHPDYEGEELVDHAMAQLKPRLRSYYERGYRLRETESRPSHNGGSYDEDNTATFIAFVERPIDDWKQIADELVWLIDRLPDR